MHTTSDATAVDNLLVEALVCRPHLGIAQACRIVDWPNLLLLSSNFIDTNNTAHEYVRNKEMAGIVRLVGREWDVDVLCDWYGERGGNIGGKLRSVSDPQNQSQSNNPRSGNPGI